MLSTIEGHFDSPSLGSQFGHKNALTMKTHHASKTEGLKRAINKNFASPWKKGRYFKECFKCFISFHLARQARQTSVFL